DLRLEGGRTEGACRTGGPDRRDVACAPHPDQACPVRRRSARAVRREARRPVRARRRPAPGRARSAPGRRGRDRQAIERGGTRSRARFRGGVDLARPRTGAPRYTRRMAEDVAFARPEGAAVLVSDVVRASGGVILRRRKGALETVLVHRPKYDDLTFPKGKARDGEPDEDTALREIEEETGLRCELGPELVSTSYVDPQGRPKRVRYWLARAGGAPSAFEPDDEVDHVEWFDVTAAERRRTDERDRAVLDAATGLGEPVYLVRHAKAGSREQWRADDDLRPLTTKGWRQAEGLVEAFADRPLASILSSPAVRCVQTVEPLA